jgi:uncharacterized protein (TIGR02757 family)
MVSSLAAFLDRSYAAYNRRELVGSDPLEIVLRYESPDDQEVVGIVAATLAFGRVAQICSSVEKVLAALGSPAAHVEGAPGRDLREVLQGFRHRFVTGADVADLLEGVGRLRLRWGSLNRYFRDRCYEPARRSGGDMWAAAGAFVAGLRGEGGRPSFLLPDPERGSACKRLHLYLRWMVRRDDVDPGPWVGVRARDLFVPMDTHMHRIGTLLGLTARKQADARASREVTEAFRSVRPSDPVRYDFPLTRIGMLGRTGEIPVTWRRAAG